MSERHTLDTVTEALRASPLLRLLAIGVLTLLLLVPIEWISALVAERLLRRGQAVEEVSKKWGQTQTVVGPALVTPYHHRWTERDAKGKDVVKSELRHLTILPAQLRVRARVQGEERYRGVFSVPVYRVALDVTGDFMQPDLRALGVDPALVQWGRTELAVGISDARTIQNRASVSWNGAEHEFRPGAGIFDVPSGIHALVEEPFMSARPAYAFQLTVNGSGGLYFTPGGQETVVSIESNWPAPSFQGNWLPGERALRWDGFSAAWNIPFLGRNQPTAWTSESSNMIGGLETAAFGVDFVTPVDAHRMADRSVKYARLFILLTFAAIWVIEVLTGVRIHPIQYLLIGFALCTFYLLELSLSEQIGFAAAYLLASAGVIVLVGLYAAVVLHGRRRALAVMTVVGGLYTYLYVLLVNEDYALLLGSLGLFAAVATTMLVTRHIDWYADKNRSRRDSDESAAGTPGVEVTV